MIPKWIVWCQDGVEPGDTINEKHLFICHDLCIFTILIHVCKYGKCRDLRLHPGIIIKVGLLGYILASLWDRAFRLYSCIMMMIVLVGYILVSL